MADLKKLGLFLGPALALIAGLLTRYAWGLEAPAAWTAAVTTLCAAWWILEPIPIPATSIIPFAVFPFTGVLDEKTIAHAYGHYLVLLFLGGFMLSAAMERSGAHRRLALMMVRAVGGGGGKRLVLGFMIASAVLSMWISNTATTLMLLPILVAVIKQSEDPELPIPLLLGVAYAASIGGLGTPIGSPPNLVFMGVYNAPKTQEMFADFQPVAFIDWMKIGLPIVIVFCPLAWWWLTRRMRDADPLKLPDPGPWRTEEVRVLLLFSVTALLWITRTSPNGGWAEWLNLKGPGDGTIALAMVVVMFLTSDGKGGRLMDWDTAVRIPWGILLLFGGGIAIAAAFGASGLSDAMGAAFKGLTALPVVAMMLLVCLFVTFLTEVTSNTATANVLMPILVAAAAAAHVDPRLLMMPAAFSCSCAFMLPVATPPNAIVFGSDRIDIRTMVREGLILNFIGVVVVTAVCYLLLR